MIRVEIEGLEDAARREALKRYLDGDEEGALDLLAAAHAMAAPAIPVQWDASA